MLAASCPASLFVVKKAVTETHVSAGHSSLPMLPYSQDTATASHIPEADLEMMLANYCGLFTMLSAARTIHVYTCIVPCV